MNLNKIYCTYHPSAELIEDHHAGDMICAECGLVVGDRFIDPSCEWRTFNSNPNKADPSRVGRSENALSQDGVSPLTTIIDNGSEYNFKYGYNVDAMTRKLLAGFAEIGTMGERINATASIVDQAKTIFKNVYNAYNLRYRSIEAKATACLYIACRQEGVPRTFKEICAVSVVSKKEIGRCFKIIVKTMATSLELVSSESFMARFCSKLSFSMELEKAATNIVQKAIEMNIVPGRSPISVAAAAIYMVSQASKASKTRAEISEMTGVAEFTISLCYKQMLEHVRDLFPASFFYCTPINQLPLL